MLKRLISGIVAMVMLISVVSISIPEIPVYAAGSIWLEVTKDNAPVRAEKSEDGKVLRKLKKGTVITAEKKELNWKLRWWYKLKNGEYIYSGNVKETHEHKVVLAYYETAHPHYAIHKCKHCDIGGTCGPETKKVKGCEKCYPTSTESKKQNTNKVPNSNVTTNSDILTPTRPSLQEEAEKNLGTPKHEHNYKHSHYETSHPHYAVYKCACGDSYKDTAKTQMQSGCVTCYPPHKHEYKFIGYNQSHPHNAMYECSCTEIYIDSETTKVKDCATCYPYGYGNDHACQFVCTTKFLNEHPHYTITECSICGKQDLDRKNTNYSKNCNICTSEFRNELDKLPDFHGRVYDLSTGGIIYTPEKVTLDQLYSFAEQAHFTLDTLGLIPCVGEIFDGINVLYYIVEANYVDAALSGAAMVPFVGVVSTSGKLIKNAGMAYIDTATKTVKYTAKKVTKEIVEFGLRSVSEVGRDILKNSSRYSMKTIKNINKISKNSSTFLDEVFEEGSVLISKHYKGTVTSPAGIQYKVGSEQGHRVLHVLERHGLSRKGKPNHGTLFNVDNEELFETIDDIYSSGDMITYVLRDDGKTDFYYQAGKVIGLKGETKLKMIYEGDTFITAYPVKKVGD